jgi:hypothetical protein
MDNAIPPITGWNNTNIIFGVLDPNNTTDMRIIFRPNGIPTPWPFLLGTLCLTLLTNLWALYSVIKKPRPDDKQTWGGRLLRNSFVLINLWRVVFGLVSNIQALVTTTRGRWSTPTGVTLLFLSTAPNYLIQDKFFGKVGLVSAVLASILFIYVFLCFFLGFISTISLFYSGYSILHVIGGNLPEVLYQDDDNYTSWSDPCPVRDASTTLNQIQTKNFQTLNSNPIYNVNFASNPQSNDVLYAEFIFNMAILTLIALTIFFRTCNSISRRATGLSHYADFDDRLSNARQRARK